MTTAQISQDFFNLVSTAIKNGVNSSYIADVICNATQLDRTKVLTYIVAVGASLNVQAGATPEEAVKCFISK